MENGHENGADMDTNGNPSSPTSSSVAGANSRWNPTKEQINMLENLYRQGIRTPNADQIQQITSRLRAFGHIEGKNVFYWFQNHKARQRQKQKQESLAYFHRFLHTSHKGSHDHHPLYRPFFSPPNVALNPYYLPQTELGFFPQQYPKVVLPLGGFMRIPMSEKINDVHGHEPPLPRNINHENSDQETLPLFPLHPTGILQGKEGPACSLGLSSSSLESIAIFDQASPAKNYGLGYSDHPFINFFSGQGSCGSD